MGDLVRFQARRPKDLRFSVSKNEFQKLLEDRLKLDDLQREIAEAEESWRLRAQGLHERLTAGVELRHRREP